MAKKLIASAAFAGFAAGLLTILLQFAFVRPLLLQAELYENGTLVHVAQTGGHDHSAHDHGAEPAQSAEHDHASHDHGAMGSGLSFELGRDGLSLVFSIFIYVGYGLMLVAGFSLAEGRGAEITARTGLLWGLAGFIAISLMPSFGLPIEMPGSAGADVTARQVWWIGTAVCTALALWSFAYGRGAMQIALGIIVLVAPHLIGAPQPDVLYGPTPPELSSLYASRALVTALAGWVVLGTLAGYFWQQEP